jgi:hypothetical protein
MMIFVFLWILCGVAAAMIGNQKGEGCSAFFIGVIFGPFGILFALLSSGNRKACPVCPRCQRNVPSPE